MKVRSIVTSICLSAVLAFTMTAAPLSLSTSNQALGATKSKKLSRSKKAKKSKSVKIKETKPYKGNFRAKGVIHSRGYTYTWYSQRVLPGRGLTKLNKSGRHVDKWGYVRDKWGYVAVASYNHKIGTVLKKTPFGKCRVYDKCPSPRVIDVYVNW